MGRREETPEAVRWTVEFKESALKDFLDLPGHVQNRFRSALDELETDPFRPRPGVGVKPLHGGAWHLRVGDYRGIYEVHGRTVVFTKFGHRSTVYRHP